MCSSPRKTDHNTFFVTFIVKLSLWCYCWHFSIERNNIILVQLKCSVKFSVSPLFVDPNWQLSLCIIALIKSCFFLNLFLKLLLVLSLHWRSSWIVMALAIVATLDALSVFNIHEKKSIKSQQRFFVLVICSNYTLFCTFRKLKLGVFWFNKLKKIIIAKCMSLEFYARILKLYALNSGTFKWSRRISGACTRPVSRNAHAQNMLLKRS